MTERCPHCGQFYPPKRRPKVKLTRMQWDIFDRVQRAGRHGIPSDRLFDMLYANDPDGGPISGKHAMYTRIFHLNNRLKSVNLIVRAPRAGQGCPAEYRLERL